MIILFEGPDRCGKGTQIQKLIHEFHDKSIHQLHYSALKGFDTKEEYTTYSASLYSSMFELLYNNYKKSHFILDRSHLGELVYGPMYRNYTGEYVLYIENYWKTYKEFWNELKLITFIDKAENLIKRDDGLSHSIELDKKQKEISLFIKATENSSIKEKLIINIDNKSIDEVFFNIKEFLI